MIHADITGKIIQCFYKIYNELGYGFLEKVYENSLMIEFVAMRLLCVQQAPIKVYYQSQKVGNYFADFLVDNKIIVEVKAGNGDILKQHEMQLSNYLKATNYKVGLILYFGEKPNFKRIIFSNGY